MKNLLLFASIILTVSMSSQTTVPAGSVSGTWTSAGSPYIMQGGVFIPNGATLTIQPGVTVNFQGHYKLLVLGRLLAIGTATDSIHFTCADTSIGWYGIRFDNTASTNDTSKIFYCSISSGKATGNDNDAYGGACMFNNFSKAIISNCLIKNNSHYAIGCTKSSPIITNCKIIKNEWGGITTFGTDNFDTSNPSISNNTISYNYGPGINGGDNTIIYNNIISYNSGVGIYIKGGVISYNTISHNNSDFWAGGIYKGFPNTVIISHNVITYNTCTNNGYAGGLFCYYGPATVSDNIITNNTSPSGAGLKVISGDPVFINNVIANNISIGTDGGGGVFCYGNNPTFINNTIANNSAAKGGGLFFSGNTTTLVKNCIIYGNTASVDGNQVYLLDQTSAPDFNYCNVQGGTNDFGLNGNVYIGNYTNNLNSAPVFVAPSAGSGAAFNGIAADWSLKSTSPCINSGDPSGTYPSTDLAGNPRVYGSSIDMGAYEYQGPDGIATYNSHSEFLIYPNPNNGNFIIESNLNEIGTLQIVDMNGREVLDQNIIGIVNIDITMLDKGVYNLTIRTKSNISNKKIVVLK